MAKTKETPFEPGEPVVYINCENMAFQGTVIEEWIDTQGTPRVKLKYWNEDGDDATASPHRERVGRKSINFH